MEDDVPPTSVKLQVLIPDEYVEEAAIAQAMELSKAEEEAKSGPDLEQVVGLTTMVADHTTSLPPPPPLLPCREG
jgi:hypothetical protein